jgi:hypothetical protein
MPSECAADDIFFVIWGSFWSNVVGKVGTTSI